MAHADLLPGQWQRQVALMEWQPQIVLMAALKVGLVEALLEAPLSPEEAAE